MEFKISQEEFAKGLSRTQSVVEKKGTMPILLNVLIEALDSEVVITATDLEIGLRSRHPAEITKSGKTTLSAKKIYEVIKELPETSIQSELMDITMRLHNTALQRVDRSAYAHGVVPMIPFTDMRVVEYAFRIPAKYKLYRENGKAIEKWILRKAVDGLVPDSILWRPKAKFWQGAGVRELLHDYALDAISDADFTRERNLPNGWQLNSKEELMYYRIFREYFGDLDNLDWMGRTKGAPVE